MRYAVLDTDLGICDDQTDVLWVFVSPGARHDSVGLGLLECVYGSHAGAVADVNDTIRG